MDARPLVLVTDSDAELRRIVEAQNPQARVECLADAGPVRARQLATAEVLVVPAWRVHEEELAELRSVRLVQSVWAGADRIPVAALHALHPEVVVATGAGPNAPQVAEHALALYLACTRRLVARHEAMRRGEWQQWAESARVAGSRVAVVGTGHVGSRLLRAFTALEASCVAVNRDGRDVAGCPGLPLSGLRARLDDVDGVVLAVPLTRETAGMVDRDWLEAMPSDGILVNVARGKLVDPVALQGHLVAHPSFHVGLDVWWSYPGRDGVWNDRHGLSALPNVVMSPHHAFQAPGVKAAMHKGAAANVARHLAGARVENVVPRE